MPESDFIKNLTSLLIRKHLTQAQLAKELGVTPSTVSMWLNGTNVPRIDMIRKIATVFDVSPASLLGWDESITMAAHFEGDEFTQEELEEIKRYADFVKSRRQ